MYILYDRPQALDRLLKSLEDAEYMDDTVALEIYVDGVRDTQKLNAFYSQQNVRGYSSWRSKFDILTWLNATRMSRILT